MAEEKKKITDPEQLALLYERFRDVCLVEKEVWKEIYMPRQVTPGQGVILTNQHERYEVIIDDEDIEDTLDANIPLGSKALGAAIEEYRSHITFVKM
ncbi:MAG: hypothetical protein MRJ96_04065 [Nitrospirales bacterium]|nr:hypothetical protein [Nitrospira sp.]MDR4500615.1 hypothetical protein [Nitrospirales bacterium]